MKISHKWNALHDFLLCNNNGKCNKCFETSGIPQKYSEIILVIKNGEVDGKTAEIPSLYIH